MKKRHPFTYSATRLLPLVGAKANLLLDARIDAAVVEYAEILMGWEQVDFNDLDARIEDAKRGGFPPTPRWRKGSPHDRD